MFCLGPYIVTSTDNSDLSSELQFTGHALEFATSTWKTTIPIYRKPPSYATSTVDLDGLLFHERFQELDIKLWRHHVVSTPIGQFLPLGSFVGALYSEYPEAASITELVRDLCKILPTAGTPSLRHTQYSGWASTTMSVNGFTITGTSSDGTRLYADFGWLSQQDGAHDATVGLVPVYSLVFRPSPNGQLRPEAWKAQDTHRFADSLWKFASKLCREKPLNAISDEGKLGLLAAYEWTPLSKLTPTEARAQRVAFIRKNLHLAEKPKELAAALKAHDLYSPATSNSQILKFLQSLIVEAKNECSG